MTHRIRYEVTAFDPDDAQYEGQDSAQYLLNFRKWIVSELENIGLENVYLRGPRVTKVKEHEKHYGV